MPVAAKCVVYEGASGRKESDEARYAYRCVINVVRRVEIGYWFDRETVLGILNA